MPMPAKFVKPMLLLCTEKLPEGPEWSVALRLDGYRAKLHFRVRMSD